MKHSLILAAILLICASTFAISSLPGTGESVPTPRQYDFQYHTGSDDLHFYGSMQWAVLFDFDEVYPTQSLSQFAIESALIWFPSLGDSAKVELFTDGNGQPVQRVAQARAQVNQNLMEFDFDTVIQTERIWMVLTYNTTINGPYVSASTGGGTHSYYLNQNYDVPFFQNMANAGFGCEFLFGVRGNFLLSTEDLELVDFSLVGDMQPETELRPEFTIYNHSSQTVFNSQINLQITSPASSEYSVNANIQITNPIPAHGSLTVTSEHPQYSSYVYTMPRDPLQIKVTAILSSEIDAADTLFNNSITKYYHIFSHNSPIRLLENFVREYHITQIADYQTPQITDDLRSLYYFPILQDSLSLVGAYQRYQWYSLFSIPVSVYNGQGRLTGLSSSYPTQLEALIDANKKTFISQNTCSLTLPSQGENLEIRINLTNSDTHLFNTNAEPNLIQSSRLYAAFFKKHNFNGRELYVLNRWIAYADTISSLNSPGQFLEKLYNTSLSNLDLEDLTQNYRLYYWIQSNTNQEILFAAQQTFQSFLSNQDELVTAPSLRIYPNPASRSANLQANWDKDYKATRLAIFNLRGQLLAEYTDQIYGKDNITLPRELFPSSGIYFLRIYPARDSRFNAIQSRKIIVF
ncbi:MAG: hypothetical protein CVU49_03805 [Candidatus Cloacimonetes bacterium HGW-Cloacimonetes-2]|nr:MAG: hypothetical protein CVU49_03805 [Candidatus Cloacimonetes bacterium HGW-Cloacimonetes-2]